MSGSNRGRKLTVIEAGLICLTLLGLVALVYVIGNVQGLGVGRDQIAADKYYQHEKSNAIGRCVDRQGPALAKCVAEAVEAAQGKSQAQQDLDAQRDMANAANWLLLATFLTFGVTGWGVYFVKRTLETNVAFFEESVKATEAMQESNRITHRQMRRELMKTRPMVRIISGARIAPVDQIFLDSMSEEDRARSCAFSCMIENSGKTDCWVEDSWIKFEYYTDTARTGSSSEYTSFRLAANIPLSAGEKYTFDRIIYLFPLHIKERIYNGEGFLRGYIVYRDNNTDTRFGATFGYRLDVASNILIAKQRTKERLDWQDGIVREVSLERYGPIFLFQLTNAKKHIKTNLITPYSSA